MNTVMTRRTREEYEERARRVRGDDERKTRKKGKAVSTVVRHLSGR
jgi:hypothetical protein